MSVLIDGAGFFYADLTKLLFAFKFFFFKEASMLVNILTLIGIGTVAWLVTKLVSKALEWIHIRKTGLRRKK